MAKYKLKESTAILNSLSAGVVPNVGIQYILVGREKEIDAILKCLSDVHQGNSIVKFWIGDYGSGKSFMLNLLKTLALKDKYVVASCDLTPERRLYSNDGRALSTYSKLIDSLSIQTKPEGNSLPVIIEKWIESIILKLAEEKDISPNELRKTDNISIVQTGLIKTLNEITDVGGFDFGLVLSKYFEGYISGDEFLMKSALRWLRGEFTTKTEARTTLGVREIINDSNYYDMLKNFGKFFKALGYKGFVINIDEAVNLYKITNSLMREKNYEKILSIYNDCYQNKSNNLFLNIAGTNEFLLSEFRGLFSYPALKSRLELNKYETNEIRDFSQPVIKMLPLNHTELFVLLKNIKSVYDFNYTMNSKISDNDIKCFMEEIFNKPGAGEFLTPREVIKEFIDILNILKQNPSLEKKVIFDKIEVKSNNNTEDFISNDIEIL